MPEARWRQQSVDPDHMRSQPHRTYFVLFVVLVAPIGAAVVVAALLLLGVMPATVFAPGWALLALLRSWGIHARNAVGIVSTVGLWWLLLVLLGGVWECRQRRRAA